MPNYASPIILNTAGRDQLFFIGCKLVTSLDPLTGKEILGDQRFDDGMRDLDRVSDGQAHHPQQRLPQ